MAHRRASTCSVRPRIKRLTQLPPDAMGFNIPHKTNANRMGRPMSMRRAILVLTSLAAVVVSGQTAVWRYLTSSHARPRPFTSRRYMAQPTVRNVASTYASGDPPTSQGSRWSMSPAEQRAFNDGLQAALLAVCIMKGEDSPRAPDSGDDVCLGCENLSRKQSQLVARIKALQYDSRSHTSALVPLRAWKVAEDAYLLHRHPPYAD